MRARSSLPVLLTIFLVGTSSASASVVVRGTPGADRLTGTTGPDVVRAGQGGDHVSGGAGPDRLHGGDGYDRLYGDAGDDRVYGGHGDDVIIGGPGHNRLVGGRGKDLLEANTHDPEGGSTYLGGEGYDQIETGPGENIVYAGPGRDLIAQDRDGTGYVNAGGGADEVWLYNNGVSDRIDCGKGWDQALYWLPSGGVDPLDELVGCEKIDINYTD